MLGFSGELLCLEIEASQKWELFLVYLCFSQEDVGGWIDDSMFSTCSPLNLGENNSIYWYVFECVTQPAYWFGRLKAPVILWIVL